MNAMFHLMVEEDRPLCGNTKDGAGLTYRDDVADCMACWRAYAARQRAENLHLREANGKLTLERDEALTGRLPPEHRPPAGHPPWSATQTANYWGNRACSLEERLRSVEATDRQHQTDATVALKARDELAAAYKTLLQHVRADHSKVQCRLCHPALVERDDAEARLAALQGKIRDFHGRFAKWIEDSMPGGPDGQ